MKTNRKSKTDNIFIKAIIVGVMTLLMLIPITFLQSLITERKENQANVEDEISSKLGGTQNLVGPILVLPYVQKQSFEMGRETNSIEEGEAYFLPDECQIEGELLPEERSRAQYHVLAYQAQLKIKGKFNFPNCQILKLNNSEINWKDAYLMIGVTHLQGIKNKINIDINGIEYSVEPGIKTNSVMQSGLAVKVPLDGINEVNDIKFNFNLSLNGTPELLITPIGRENNIHIKSSWNTVSFSGEFLPSERTINNDGFDARWNVFDYNRNYIQQWKVRNSNAIHTTSINGTLSQNMGHDSMPQLGIALKYPVDQYQMATRSVKYAILFIILTFVAFFLIEILASKPIHPIQYLLVSFALVLFYLLLLAFSEYIGFGWSYLISTIAIVGLITTYSTSILSNRKQTIFICGFLSILFLFLYVLLQLEDQALLFGSIGLFVALAIIMFASRKIDWYKKQDSDNMVIQTPPPPYFQSNDVNNDAPI